MRLGTKIIISFVCVSTLLALIGIISDQCTSEIRQEQFRNVNEASVAVTNTSEMERSLFQSLIFLNGVRESLAAEGSYETVQEFPAAVEQTAKFEEELEKFEKSVINLRLYLKDGEQLLNGLEELLKSYEVYKAISREWLSLGGEDISQANRMFINSIEPYFRNNIIPEITELRTSVLAFQDQQSERLDRSLERAATINYIATILSVLFSLVLAVYIYRSIANPISKVSESAKKLGEGHLDERIFVSSKDEIGELAEAFNNMAAGLQKSTVSKAYLDNIIESIQEALFVADKEGKLVRVNSAAADMMGYLPDEMPGISVERFYNIKEMGKVYEEHQNTGNTFEFSLIHKNGDKIPVLFSEAKLFDIQNNYVGTVSVASDISDRKKAEEEIRNSLREKEVMLAEIHHRVKNNLAVISGLIQLQSYSAGNAEVEKALTDSQMRIHSIALVHEMLYESESLAFIQYDKYINDLLESIRSLHLNDSEKITLSSDVVPLQLNVNQAIPCSLLVNELIVNAYEYGLSDEEGGNIQLSISDEDEQITIKVSDKDKGLDSINFEEGNSLTISLIKTLTKQLRGTFSIENHKAGTGIIFVVQFEREIK